MNRSICQIMPNKKLSMELQTVNFVYETEFKKMQQPFNCGIYYIHIVTRGSGTLKVKNIEYPLTASTMFFALPSVPYTIDASPDFEYIYISFTGSMTEKLKISHTSCVYYNLDNVAGFWKETIRRITPENAIMLTECALYYALSYANDSSAATLKENIFDMIVDYIDKNFTDHDLSVKKVAGIFSYTEKYLSSLFKRNMEVTFTSYLNSLRISHSLRLMENGEKSVSDIAAKSGFSDPLYFSKVFKKNVGLTPSKKIKSIKQN